MKIDNDKAATPLTPEFFSYDFFPPVIKDSFATHDKTLFSPSTVKHSLPVHDKTLFFPPTIKHSFTAHHKTLFSLPTLSRHCLILFTDTTIYAIIAPYQHTVLPRLERRRTI